MRSRKRKLWTAWKEIMGAFLLGIAVIWATGSMAQAASAAEEINLVIGIDGNEELVYASPGVCVNSDGVLAVFAGRYDSSIQAEIVAVQTDRQICLLEYGNDWTPLQGYNLGLWIMAEEGLENVDMRDRAFMETGYPHQNEGATAVYYCMSGDELVKDTSDIVLKDMSEEGVLTADSYPAGALYPAALVNASGQLVGMLLDDGVCIAAAGSLEIFYGQESGGTGGSAPSRGTETAPPLPSRGSSVSVPAGNNSSSGGLSDTAYLLIGLAAVIVVVLIILIVVIAVIAGKKKTPGNRNVPAAAQMPDQAGAAPSPAREKKPTAGKKGQTLWLLAKGGCMNGRVYPVGQEEITIGRDASMVIRFPAGTAGVSRIHAKLYWQGGQLMLMDCNSTSGTFLKRMGKIAPMSPVAIQSGDVFYIGEKANCFEVSTS